MSGPTGTTGPQGFTGPTGPTGPAGPVGTFCRYDVMRIATNNWYGGTYGDPSPPYNFSSPFQTAFDGERIWITNGGNNSVTGINACNGSFIIYLIGAPYNFDNPSGIVFDGIHMWVCNNSNNTITAFNAIDGSFYMILSSATYMFNFPYGICFDGTKLWVANFNSLTTFFPSGAFNSNIVAGSTNTSILFDGMNIWVAATGIPNIQAYNMSGTFQYSATPTDPALVGIIFGGQYLWSIGSTHLQAFDLTSGATVFTIDTTTAPYNLSGNLTCIGFDGSNVWVGDSNGLSSHVALTNAYTSTFVSVLGGLGSPYGFVDPDWMTFDGTFMWITNDSSETITSVFMKF